MYLGNMLKTTVLGHKYNKKKKSYRFFRFYFITQSKKDVFLTLLALNCSKYTAKNKKFFTVPLFFDHQMMLKYTDHKIQK